MRLRVPFSTSLNEAEIFLARRLTKPILNPAPPDFVVNLPLKLTAMQAQTNIQI
jgi:hypothetical protein